MIASTAQRPAFRVLALFLLCVLYVGSAEAASLGAGNAAYQNGDYISAIGEYESLIAEGIVHEDLYYNLGNANFRAGRFGHALFNYERALRVAPGQEDSLYNLAVAREVVAQSGENRLEGAEKDPWWVRASVSFSIASITFVLLLCNLLLFGGLVWLRFMVAPLLRTCMIVMCVFLGAFAATSGLLLFGHTYTNDKIHNGIVTADLTIMREGPDATLEERGQLHPGLRVSVIRDSPEWLLVRLANGVEGWVPRASIGLFD